jgi:hypothetical protein
VLAVVLRLQFVREIGVLLGCTVEPVPEGPLGETVLVDGVADGPTVPGEVLVVPEVGP